MPLPFDDLTVLGAMSPVDASNKLEELGETELAAEIRAHPVSSQYRLGGSWIWPFRTKAWQYTTHAFGYLAATHRNQGGLRDIVDVSSVRADEKLRNSQIKVTLDAFRVAEYPGSGVHQILLDFYARNQIRPAPETVHFNAVLRVRAGQQAAIRGYPIFLGLNTGEDGVEFRCLTVNVKNEYDQSLLPYLESDTFKAGLRLATVAQPALAPLAELTKNLTEGIAKKQRNVPVQSIHLGLDFSDNPTGARLRHGSYIAVQIPDTDRRTWDWRDWVFDPSNAAIAHRRDLQQMIPYNYLVFAISEYRGNR